ncbi:MAG: YIP1 family protein [Gaiellaceae bacterium]
MSARAEPAIADERLWLLRAVLVLRRPREVFAALRDDSEEAARARQEAVTALTILAGVAAILWTPTWGHLMDDPVYDGLLVAVVSFIGGAIYGPVLYWLIGLLLYAGERVASAGASFRRARHVVAYAAAPIALSLLIWPARLAIYGEDLFRSGGSDKGAGNLAFVGVELAFVAWALALLVLGAVTVNARAR